MCSRGACSRRFGHQLEERAGHRTLGRADDAHALHQRLGLRPRAPPSIWWMRSSSGCRWRLITPSVSSSLTAAGGHQQAVQLALVEPQAGQFVLLAAVLGTEAVGVEVAVVLDRRAQAVAQVLQVALERGRRDLQLLQQRLAKLTCPRSRISISIL
jgi:hypothetical protein